LFQLLLLLLVNGRTDTDLALATLLPRFLFHLLVLVVFFAGGGQGERVSLLLLVEMLLQLLLDQTTEDLLVLHQLCGMIELFGAATAAQISGLLCLGWFFQVDLRFFCDIQGLLLLFDGLGGRQIALWSGRGFPTLLPLDGCVFLRGSSRVNDVCDSLAADGVAPWLLWKLCILRSLERLFWNQT